MASIDEDFPRGGSAKKASEPKPAKPRVEVDNLFETRKPETKKKKKANKQERDKTPQAGGLKLNTASNVDILHLKNLKVGTVMLGCVKEVSEFEVVLGLPNGLKGYLPISSICKAYNKILGKMLDGDGDLEDVVSPSHLLTPGLLVRCVVSSLEQSKEGFVILKVSIDPKEVNKELHSSSLKAGMTLGGCVESVEDHGFLIDIGVRGTKAFLPKETKKNGAKSFKRDLKVGQYVTVLLVEVQGGGRVVRLSLDPMAVAEAIAEIQHGWTLGSLVPGLLVQAHVKKVTAHGLVVTFLASYTGTVDFMHIDPGKASTYAIGDKVKARVLYVEPSSRLVGLSLRSHLLPPGGDVLDREPCERVGEVLHGCKMSAVHHHSGAVLELPDGAVAFVHKNQMKEPKEEFNLNRQLAQTEHTLRITGFSSLEQMYLATLRKSIVDAKFFSYLDISVGQLIEGTIQRLEQYGMHVKISDHVKGLVPRIHLADVVLSNPEKKFKEGMRVMCRVLSVDPANKKLVLTRKKALIESQLPVFTTYADARPGLVSHGFVVSIKDFGCIVRFCGDVKGLVPTMELTAEPIFNAKGLFYIGQVVKAKVLNCDAQAEKLLLSFRAVTQEDVHQVDVAKFTFEVGKKVKAVVLRKDLTGLQVSILPEKVPALLPTVHLSDHVTNCPLLWAGLQEGDTVSNAVCLSNSKQSITLTKKPLLMAALEAGAMVTAFSELKVGVTMLGWVKSIMPFGIFIDFPHGLCGLAPKAAISDKFITDTAGLFEVGQTVLAKVTNMDEEKHRFLVSLKLSDVSLAEGDAQYRLIQGQLERRTILDMMTSRDDSASMQQLASVALGDKLKMTVGETMEDGSVCLISDQLRDVTVSASKYHTTGVNTTPGRQITAVVLHVDPVTPQVHVSLLPKLTEKKKKLEEGSQHTATVQYVDEDFAIISLGSTGHLTMVSMTIHLNEVFRFDSEKLSVGQKLTVIVIEPKCEDLGGRSLVARQPSDALHGLGTFKCKDQYEIGQEVTAVIKAIKPLHVQLSLPGGGVGSVHVSQIQEAPAVGSSPTSSLKIGTEVKARFIGHHDVKGHNFLPISHANLITLPEFSLLPRKTEEDVDVQTWENIRKYTPGEEIRCYVSKYVPEQKYLEIAVSPKVYGRVELLAMTKKPREANYLKKLFRCGQCLMAKVVWVSINSQQLNLSLIGTHQLKQGTVTMGMVQETDPQNGLVLKLPFGNCGLASLTDLSDTYMDDPLQQYKVGQLVRCCILQGQKIRGKMIVSLRLSRTHGDEAPPIVDVDFDSTSELSEGQVVRGYVKDIGKGIFVRLSRSVIGRVLIQNATNYFVSDPEILTKHIPHNALVTAKVLHVDAQSDHVDLSLLPEDTGKSDVLPESLGLPLRLRGKDKEKYDKMSSKRKRSASESKQDGAKKKRPKKQKEDAMEEKTEETPPPAEDLDSGIDVFFREEEIRQAKKKGKSKPEAPRQRASLQVTSAFCWDAALSSLKPAVEVDKACESSAEEDDERSKPAKKSRREAEQERQEAERKLSRLEAELQDPTARPESPAQFERLLLSSPDSSVLWLQYMAFHLQATQIEQARAVAERALRTISFREEQEKLNVWVALLNLENMYGTEESLKKVFERAVQFCEPMLVYQQLADIYAKSGKVKEAESLYKNMVKRFRQQKTVWQSYGSFLLRQGQSDAANALLQRALQSLSSKEHVDLITRFARMEFQYGNSERATAMFEKVLSSYPKRTDLWSIFIDLTMKHGSQKDVRDLLDRVIHLSVSVKKVKFFFKRYLDYEKKHGTPESIQAVKQKALEYVESKGSGVCGV
ncbi:protein RRP5 homolog [Brachyhypopomus gauderio]|uniref:protein RRP5 homolog n=1 Tax=Brachyhypopomus gauderio TaxID=698409 RepID=UPI004042B3BE